LRLICRRRDAIITMNSPDLRCKESPFMDLIDLDKIAPAADQPRKSFDQGTLLELAMSIRERGVLEPIVVRPPTQGAYEIVMAERR